VALKLFEIETILSATLRPKNNDIVEETFHIDAKKEQE